MNNEKLHLERQLYIVDREIAIDQHNAEVQRLRLKLGTLTRRRYRLPRQLRPRSGSSTYSVSADPWRVTGEMDEIRQNIRVQEDAAQMQRVLLRAVERLIESERREAEEAERREQREQRAREARQQDPRRRAFQALAQRLGGECRNRHYRY